MDHDPKTPIVESLRLLPYSELKKIAKQRGIKGNLKAEKIIAALTAGDSSDADSFSTPAAKMLNSSHKKKLEKLDEDHMTPLVTPRRGTYTVEPPIAIKLNEASPSVETLDVTSSTVNESSAFDMSNVTVGRGSERKLRSGRKVSFLSPVMTPHTPKNSNLKMRPKTPIVLKTPLTADVFSPMKELQVDLGERVDVSMNLHSSPKKFLNMSDAEITPLAVKENASGKKMKNSTPKRTPLVVKKNASGKKMKNSTPMLTKFASNKNELSKKKRVETPNFKKIHEKAFEKMESIEDYQKRILNSAKKLGAPNFKANKITKAKTKIPAFGGIPFIPSVSKIDAAKGEASRSFVKKSKLVEEKRKPKKNVENIKLDSKRQSKFDLRASLSRKLGYKPYTGKLKPLTPSTLLNTSSAICEHKGKETPAKESISKTVISNRMQSRSILKGVRTNKRFELQMKNRMNLKAE